MGNPILQSESFDRAVYEFSDTIVNRVQPLASDFGENVHRLGQAAEKMADAVRKLAQIEGMKVANAERERHGLAPAYGEKAFFEL